MLPDAVRQAIDEIREDHTHGARWLTRRAAEVLLALARTSPTGQDEACAELAAVQPAMAPLIRLASEAAAAATPVELEAIARRAIERLERAGTAVAENAAALIADGATVLTHSYSATVEAALITAHAHGTRFRVSATESQPLGEGVRLAGTLEKAGLAVTLIRDDAVPVHVRSSTLVMVGADTVAPSGVVNKVGTAAIARAAREFNVPFYVVCTSDKLLPACDFRDGSGLYDITPLALVTGIVTEQGILPPDRVR